MRRVLQLLAVVATLGVFAVPAQAQLSFGVHGAAITSVSDIDLGGGETYGISGTFGLGGRMIVSPPIAPVQFVGSAEYYFPSCPAGFECDDLWTASAAVNLGLPMPMVRPYATGGIQYRGGGDEGESAWLAGLGVQLNFAVSVFVEGIFEFVDVPAGVPDSYDMSPFVLKAGIVF